jgi:hypothetical protein
MGLEILGSCYVVGGVWKYALSEATATIEAVCAKLALGQADSLNDSFQLGKLQ